MRNETTAKEDNMKVNQATSKKALEIIAQHKTRETAMTALKAAGIKGGLSLECWVAYNNLPN